MGIRLVGDARMPATDDATSSVASATITLPDGILANDIFLVVVGVRSATVTPSVTTTGGQTWTSGTQLQANNLTVNYFWCRVSGAFTNPVIGWTTANSYALWAFHFRGVDTTTAIDATAVLTAQAAAATFTNGASYITTATNNALVLHAMVSADNNTWGSHTAGFTLPYARTQWRNSNTTGTSITAAYQAQGTAGGSASFSATEATLGNDAGIRFAVALRPASAAAVSNFAKVDDIDTGTTTSAVTKTGYAGQPKLVLGTQTRVVGASGGIDGLKQGLCVMAEGKTRALYAGAVDAVGFGNSVIALYKNLFAVAFDPANPDADASAKGKATLAATSDGFTFTPSVAFTENGRISTLALGGDDIVACDIADFSLPTAVGSVTYSNLFPFQPDFLIFPNTWRTGTAYNLLTTTADSDECVGTSVGFCDASLNQAAVLGGANSQASGATTGSSISKTGSAYLEFDWTAEFNGTHALRYDGAITALTSSGFTMNWTTVSGTTAGADLRCVVGIKLSAAGLLRVISANSATSVTTVDITTDVGGTSLSGHSYCGVFVGSGCNGTGGAARTDETLTLGMSDGTAHRAAFWWYDEGGGSAGSVPTDDRSYRTASYAYVQRTNDNTSGAVGSATISSLTDKVTLNFDDGDPSANTIVGFVFGPAAASGSSGTVATTTTNASLAAAGQQIHQGTVNTAVPMVTLASSGTEIDVGSLGVTLAAPTLSSGGGSTVLGTVSNSLPLPSLAAFGDVGSDITGTVTYTTTVPDFAASGTTAVTGTSAPTSDLATLSASGSPADVGIATPTGPIPTLAAAGSHVVGGDLITTTTLAALAAAGTTVIQGTVNVGTTLVLLAGVPNVQSQRFRRFRREYA